MAKITKIIGPQGYELIRDRIASILAEELFNQVAMTYDESLDADIYTERFVPISNEECPVINVSLASGQFDNYTMIDHHGTYIFDIDGYFTSATIGNDRADELATKSIHKLMGVVKSILLNPVYDTLDFPAPFIEHKHVESINVATPKLIESESMVMSRLQLIVRCTERLDLIEAIRLCQSNTSVRVNGTEKGYLYSYVGCALDVVYDEDDQAIFDDDTEAEFDN